MKIALAQINPTVGALEKNTQKIIDNIQQAKSQHCDLLIFPEMTIIGYPPKDLLLKKNLIDKNLTLLHSLIPYTENITIIVGFVDRDQQAKLGANLIINISASPFHAGKATIRENLIAKRAKENNIPIIYTNLVGAQDDLIFDGRSYFFNEQGQKISQGKAFEEDFIILPQKDIIFNSQQSTELQPTIITATENITKDIHDALVLGIKDYFQKNGFKKAVIGLSGGIDSALTAALALAALGKENGLGIT